MKQVFFVSSDTYAANGGTAASTIDKINNLSTGVIALYGGSSGGTGSSTSLEALIPSDATAILGSSIRFVSATASMKHISPDIDRASFSYIKQAYTAPVKKIMYVSGDGNTASSASTLPTAYAYYAQVNIVNKQKSRTSKNVVSYSVPTTTASTATTIIDALVAKINADSTRIVNAAKVGSTTTLGMSLTAVNFEEDFEVSVEGLIADFAVRQYGFVSKVPTSGYTYATAYKKGTGTVKQALEAEREFHAELGNANYQNMNNNEIFTLPSAVVAGKTYTIYTISYKTIDNKKLQHGGEPYIKTIEIYVESGLSTVMGVLDTLLALV